MRLGFLGIDPGFSGALGWIASNGDSFQVHDLPVVKVKKRLQFDIPALNALVYGINQWTPELVVGLEDPTTRPGEGAERCKRFGEGIGILKGLLTAHQISYECISPNLWKGRLGLPGKDKKGANMAGAQLLVSQYPQMENMVYGPRGGIKDGRLDALLIAHWMRINHGKA